MSSPPGFSHQVAPTLGKVARVGDLQGDDVGHTIT